MILVSGGAIGIGGSICKKLAEEGAMPYMLDRDKEKYRMLLEELNGNIK